MATLMECDVLHRKTKKNYNVPDKTEHFAVRDFSKLPLTIPDSKQFPNYKTSDSHNFV
jgi:hypothetical protein